jgi:alpha-ketoglutarate-dependent taurine dioxygenase
MSVAATPRGNLVIRKLHPHIERVVGMPAEEGRALVKELIDWCTRSEYVYRHRWQKHDLVMWDNRCALHRATLIPEKEHRIMHRTTVAGEGPVQ